VAIYTVSLTSFLTVEAEDRFDALDEAVRRLSDEPWEEVLSPDYELEAEREIGNDH
jgi:hypothetical protein